jgi:DNA adenine methylase
MMPFMPAFDGRYIELFAGSACLLFHIAAEQAVLVDNNSELISFYRTLSEHPSEVYEEFIKIPRDAAHYYATRAYLPFETEPLRKAAHFLYINRNCFNGIYRTNTKGLFNVPFAGSRVARYPSLEELKATANVLSRTKLICGDFEVAGRAEVARGDFVYLDPPYYVPSVRVFREYSAKPFVESDLQRLAMLLDEIDRRGAKFLLSYPDCPLISDLARKWSSDRVSVRRSVSGSTAARGYVPELLIRNYDESDP